MKTLWMIVLISIVCVGTVAFSSRADNTSVKGDYVEVRTASVFAGACHYNGEVTTTGRDALMAWNVSSGQWQGVDLAGVRVLAIVSADSNLSDKDAARRSEIIIDSAASRSQALAMLNALKEKYAASLGKIVTVRNAPITFERAGRTYAVAADDVAINVEAIPNDLCCK